MTKKAAHKRKPELTDAQKRPEPTQTVYEIMREHDARNLLHLGDNLLRFMPEHYKEQLKKIGIFVLRVRNYDIQIIDRKRFEPNGRK